MIRNVLLSLGLTLFLLSIAAAFVDLSTVLDALGQLTLSDMLIAFGLVQVQIILSAWRWRFTALRLGQCLSWIDALHGYYLASALNLVLPGGVAGDVVRGYRHGRQNSDDWARSASSIFLERASGQIGFFLLLAIGLAIWAFAPSEGGGAIFGLDTTSAEHGDVSSGSVMLAALVVLTAIVGFLALRLWYRKKRSWFSARITELRQVFWQDHALAFQLSISLVIALSYVLTFALTSASVGAPLPWTSAIAIISLTLMTMLIPAGIGGWGTREAAAAALWPLVGFTPELGLAASLAYGMVCLVSSVLPAAVWFAVERGRLVMSVKQSTPKE